MFWLIILIIIAGALLIKLGALSVLVTVLAVSLKVVIGLSRESRRKVRQENVLYFLCFIY